MHAPPSPAPDHTSPAFLLAFVLLGALAVAGWQMTNYLRMAPSTPLPLQALNGGAHRAPGSARLSTQPEPRPYWSDLNTPQKEALYPLANRWSLLSEAQKRNWLHLAAGFHALSPEEQAKMLARITDWASLSAQQRSQARLNFAAAAQLPAENKRAQWEAYQALSAEEKKRLAAKAAPKPSGAATAVRPVSPKKLARVPAATNSPAAIPNPPKIQAPIPLHTPQALPIAPPWPPVIVETAPIAMPSATPAPLPPLRPAPEPETRSEPAHDSTAPPHPLQ